MALSSLPAALYSGKVALNTVQLALKHRAGVGAAFHKRFTAFLVRIGAFKRTE